ncbi:MAG: hypothetical protein FD139_2655 [Methylocystaceae bacterium]|nr:MAG: hypothetical protein FD172_2675 [Methylocystaceae bacterium]TXT43822.1 MAG: hypothetical protein FD139_2655 [Methylocystaceae bacterium]
MPSRRHKSENRRQVATGGCVAVTKAKSRTPSHTIGVTEETYRRVDRGLVQSNLRLITGVFRIIQGVSRITLVGATLGAYRC